MELKHYLFNGNSYCNYKSTLYNINNQHSNVILRLLLEKIYNYEPGIVKIILYFMNNNIFEKEKKDKTDKINKTNIINMLYNNKFFVVKTEKNYGGNNIHVEQFILTAKYYYNGHNHFKIYNENYNSLIFCNGLPIDTYNNRINCYIHKLMYGDYNTTFVNNYSINIKKMTLQNHINYHIKYNTKIICISPIYDLYNNHNQLYNLPNKYNTMVNINKPLINPFLSINHVMRNKIISNINKFQNINKGLDVNYNRYNYVDVEKYLILMNKFSTKFSDKIKNLNQEANQIVKEEVNKEETQELIKINGFYDENYDEKSKHFYCFTDCDCSYYKKPLYFKI